MAKEKTQQLFTAINQVFPLPKAQSLRPFCLTASSALGGECCGFIINPVYLNKTGANVLTAVVGKSLKMILKPAHTNTKKKKKPQHNSLYFLK
jgi:hypothetical protein